MFDTTSIQTTTAATASTTLAAPTATPSVRGLAKTLPQRKASERAQRDAQFAGSQCAVRKAHKAERKAFEQQEAARELEEQARSTACRHSEAVRRKAKPKPLALTPQQKVAQRQKAKRVQADARTRKKRETGAARASGRKVKAAKAGARL